jgi:hypothetical protein
VSSRATRKTNRGQFFARRLGKHLHRDRRIERELMMKKKGDTYKRDERRLKIVGEKEGNGRG